MLYEVIVELLLLFQDLFIFGASGSGLAHHWKTRPRVQSGMGLWIAQGRVLGMYVSRDHQEGMLQVWNGF